MRRWRGVDYPIFDADPARLWTPLTPQEFEAHLKGLRAFVEGPCEEMQADIEVM